MNNKQLAKEINHIIESGPNDIRLIELFERYAAQKVDSISKSFNGTSVSDLESGELFIGIAWEDFLPDLQRASRLRDGETIEGIIASNAGLKIIMSKKRVRKAYEKKDKTEKQL